jgi:Tfp pilus tip-associated adhesin PilY1
MASAVAEGTGVAVAVAWVVAEGAGVAVGVTAAGTGPAGPRQAASTRAVTDPVRARRTNWRRVIDWGNLLT